MTVVDNYLYLCHENYLSKWSYGIGKCVGIIDLGFHCSAMLSTSKGILVGGNLPYLFCLSDKNLSHRKWDISPACVFAIGEFESLVTVAGTGPLVDVLNNTDRVCSLAASP